MFPLFDPSDMHAAIAQISLVDAIASRIADLPYGWLLLTVLRAICVYAVGWLMKETLWPWCRLVMGVWLWLQQLVGKVVEHAHRMGCDWLDVAFGAGDGVVIAATKTAEATWRLACVAAHALGFAFAVAVTGVLIWFSVRGLFYITVAARVHMQTSALVVASVVHALVMYLAIIVALAMASACGFATVWYLVLPLASSSAFFLTIYAVPVTLSTMQAAMWFCQTAWWIYYQASKARKAHSWAKSVVECIPFPRKRIAAATDFMVFVQRYTGLFHRLLSAGIGEPARTGHPSECLIALAERMDTQVMLPKYQLLVTQCEDGRAQELGALLSLTDLCWFVQAFIVCLCGTWRTHLCKRLWLDNVLRRIKPGHAVGALPWQRVLDSYTWFGRQQLCLVDVLADLVSHCSPSEVRRAARVMHAWRAIDKVFGKVCLGGVWTPSPSTRAGDLSNRMGIIDEDQRGMSAQ